MLLRQKYYCLISLLLISVCFPAVALAVGERLFAAQFLAYQYSARAQGMGLYGIALPEDKQVNLYNPSIPGKTFDNAVSCYYGKYFWDDFVSSLGVVLGKPTQPVAFGVQVLQCYSPGIERYSNNDVALGSIDAVQRYFLFSLKRTINEKSAIGVALGYIGENYDIYDYNTVLLNVGYHNYFLDHLLLGVVFNNISASKLGMDDIEGGIGLGATYFASGVTVAAEYIYVNALLAKLNVGVEIDLNEQLKLRGGSMNGAFLGGMGLESGNVVIDYSYKPHILGDLHLLSLSFFL